jgi:hypothetical protein
MIFFLLTAKSGDFAELGFKTQAVKDKLFLQSKFT